MYEKAYDRHLEDFDLMANTLLLHSIDFSCTELLNSMRKISQTTRITRRYSKNVIFDMHFLTTESAKIQIHFLLIKKKTTITQNILFNGKV